MTNPSRLTLLILILACGFPPGCAVPGDPPGHYAAFGDNHASEIRNLHRINGTLLSGAAPESPAAFGELQRLGVKTLISVDAATPKVEWASARGIRCVHIPVTYAEITDAQRLEIARAVRDLPGPIYIHCHHGLHRGPTAAALAAIALGMMTSEQGTAFITEAGTSPAYSGLYDCVARASRATKAQLDAAAAEFPSARAVLGTQAAMVEIDVAWEHLEEIKAAGWTTPNHSPDLVPAAEAGRLADHFRLAREDAASVVSNEEARAEYIEKLTRALRKSMMLEGELIAGSNAAVLDATYKVIQGSCKDCHAKFRTRKW
jgi:protein tyrosine phosphatase (PTP) superfamily phosphohydrolase (DUF442 family)